MSQQTALMPPRLRAPRAPVALLLALLLILFAPTATFAQTLTTDSQSEDLVTINMRDADIRAVVQWIAEQTHKQVVIDPRVQGRVTVLADQPMSVEQAYRVFLALLDTNGYAASETGGVLRIYPSPLAKSSPRELVERFTGDESGGQVLHVVQLQQVPATNLAELLRPLLGTGGHVAALAETNSLLLADSAENAKRLAALAQRMDTRGNLDIDVVKLRHAGAREAAQVLTSLTGAAGQAGGGGQSMPLIAAADERSNAVLLTGDPLNRRRARDLLAQLDQPISTRGNTRVVYLHYVDAEEMVPILKGMISTVQEEATEEQSRSASISIEASKSNNALVLSGPSTLLDSMEQVIERLDIRRAQVLVEALIVEVSASLGERLGIEWNTSLRGDGVHGATRFEVGAPSATDELLDLATSGLTLGYYRNGSLRALINALATSSEANILSTPSILTLDNQEAQILVGSNVPIVTGQATSAGAGIDNPFTTIERQDIGVTLKIKPHINAGDAVTLDLLQEVETLADAANVPGLGDVRDIVTNKRSLSTKVLVEDDAILVLGGLIRDETQKTVRKVPLLGDMPLVGRLFRRTDETATKSNLMIFIRPLIVDSEAVAESVTRRAYDGMRSQQLKYSEGKFIDGGTMDKAKPVMLPEFDTIEPRKPAAIDVPNQPAP
jgi:general secretion pathway protein D